MSPTDSHGVLAQIQWHILTEGENWYAGESVQKRNKLRSLPVVLNRVGQLYFSCNKKYIYGLKTKPLV